MDFINYIQQITPAKEVHKGIYGQVVPNYHTIEDVVIDTVKIHELKNLGISYDKTEDRLDIMFDLYYKGYKLAETDFEFFNPNKIDFVANEDRIFHLQKAIKNLEKEYFNTVSKFEIKANELWVQAKNKDLNFLFKTHFDKINICIDFENTSSFINYIKTCRKDKQLFYNACRSLTDEQLVDIAEADYGYEEDAFKELKQICETEIVPEKIEFETSEVLSLVSYGHSEEHIEILFVCMVIILGDYDYTLLEDIEDKIVMLFLSARKLDLVSDARAFLLDVLKSKNYVSEIITIAYMVLACDLFLKEERELKKILQFLQEIAIQEIDLGTTHTAKTYKEATLIMLDNLAFIKDKQLKNEIKELLTTMQRLCKERYNLRAINALFERTFSKQEQAEYLKLLPKLVIIEFRDRYKYLIAKGLNAMQVEILTKSLFNAERFLDGSDYEVDLNKNIFFDAWLKLYKTKT